MPPQNDVILHVNLPFFQHSFGPGDEQKGSGCKK
jgi:hypothetical protein